MCLAIISERPLLTNTGTLILDMTLLVHHRIAIPFGKYFFIYFSKKECVCQLGLASRNDILSCEFLQEMT